MNENDKKALNRITKQAAKITQCLHLSIYFPVFILLLYCTCIWRLNKHYSDSELTSIYDLYCNIVTKKVKCIMANGCHALHDYYVYMRTGTRLRALSCRRQRYRKSFVPNSIHVTNNQ